MGNRWGIAHDELVVWSAMLPAARQDDLHAWRAAVLEVGEEQGVYRVEEIPDLGFRRGQHGPLTTFLAARPDLDAGILLFDDWQLASSRMAFFDQAGVIVEAQVTNLNAVLADDHRAIPGRNYPPLTLTAGLTRPDGHTVEVTLATRTDLWLPWNYAVWDLRPEEDPGDFVDNRMLAARNAPRLNAFIAALREQTRRCAGTWALDTQATSGEVRFEVGDVGVHLEAPQPSRRET